MSTNTMKLPQRDWITPHQAAAYLGVGLKTIYRWLKNNEFQGAKQFGCIWRIPRATVKPPDHAEKS